MDKFRGVNFPMLFSTSYLVEQIISEAIDAAFAKYCETTVATPMSAQTVEQALTSDAEEMRLQMPYEPNSTSKKLTIFKDNHTSFATICGRYLNIDSRFGLRSTEKLFRLPKMCARGQISPISSRRDYDIGGLEFI